MAEYDDAIADYTEAIRLNPEYYWAYNDREAAYNKKGDFRHTIADFTEMIRLDPENGEAYHIRGGAYFLRGQKSKAEADFDKAKELGFPPE